MSKNKKESKKGFSTLNRILIIQLVLMLGLSLFITKKISDSTEQNAVNHMNAISGERAHIIQSYVEQTEDLLINFSKADLIEDALSHLDDADKKEIAQQYTEAYAANIDNLEGLWIGTWASEVYTHQRRSDVGAITRKDPDRLQQLHDSLLEADNKAQNDGDDDPDDGVYNTGIILSPVGDHAQIVSMYKTIYSKTTGEPVGWVGLGLYTEGLLDTLNSIEKTGIEHSFYTMVNVNDGNYIFYQPDQLGMVGQPASSEMQKLCEKFKGKSAEEGGQYEYKDKSLGKDKYVSIYSYIPKYGWILTIDDTKKEVFDLTSTMRTYLGIFAALILAMTIVFYLISKRQERINQKLVSTIAKSSATKKSLNTAMFKDVLTEANNRISFSMDIEKAAESGLPHYFMMFNICRFSDINTQYGSDAGDRMLVRTVESLREIFPDNEIYRTGSDEFVVVVPTKNGQPATEEIVDRTNTALRQLLVPEKIDDDTAIYPKYKVAILRKNSNIDSSVVTVLKDMTNNTGEAIYGMIDFQEQNR